MNKLSSLLQVKNYRPRMLSPVAHAALAKTVTLFKVQGNHLTYTHVFPEKEYSTMLQKMNRIGQIADEMDHHPEWRLSASSLWVGLSTHQIGGNISVKDYLLGRWIEIILKQKPLQDTLIQDWNALGIKTLELD